MCGRFEIRADNLTRELFRRFALSEDSIPELFNVAPTDQAPIIRSAPGGYELTSMRWWLVPSWSDGPSQKYAMFNARIESAAKSPAFRGPLARQRGVMPASGFIEWRKAAGGSKEPLWIAPTTIPMAFAAIWDCWGDDLLSCSILTQPPTEGFAKIHSRMPVMLSGDALEYWLDPATSASEAMAIASSAAIPLTATPIAREIGDSRVKNPVKPISKAFTVDGNSRPDLFGN